MSDIIEVIDLITRTEVMAVNLALDVNGRACPGPVLSHWAVELGDCVKVSQQQALLAAMAGQGNPAAIDTALYDYLVVAFRVGYEAGRQKLEIPPCEPGHHDD